MRQNANGIDFEVRADGTVSHCSDWVSLFMLARERRLGLSLVSYGAATYGHTEVLAGPWADTVEMGGRLMRLN